MIKKIGYAYKYKKENVLRSVGLSDGNFCFVFTSAQAKPDSKRKLLSPVSLKRSIFDVILIIRLDSIYRI